MRRNARHPMPNRRPVACRALGGLLITVSLIGIALAVGCVQGTLGDRTSQPSENDNGCEGGACPICPTGHGSGGEGQRCSLSGAGEPECEIFSAYYVPDDGDSETGTVYVVFDDETIALRPPESPEIPEDDAGDANDSCPLDQSGGSSDSCCLCDMSDSGDEDLMSSRSNALTQPAMLRVGVFGELESCHLTAGNPLKFWNAVRKLLGLTDEAAACADKGKRRNSRREECGQGCASHHAQFRRREQIDWPLQSEPEAMWKHSEHLRAVITNARARATQLLDSVDDFGFNIDDVKKCIKDGQEVADVPSGTFGYQWDELKDALKTLDDKIADLTKAQDNIANGCVTKADLDTLNGLLKTRTQDLPDGLRAAADRVNELVDDLSGMMASEVDKAGKVCIESRPWNLDETLPFD